MASNTNGEMRLSVQDADGEFRDIDPKDVRAVDVSRPVVDLGLSPIKPPASATFTGSLQFNVPFVQRVRDRLRRVFSLN